MLGILALALCIGGADAITALITGQLALMALAIDSGSGSLAPCSSSQACLHLRHCSLHRHQMNNSQWPNVLWHYVGTPKLQKLGAP